MSQLPINPLSPDQQQKMMGQLYMCMGKQVRSYHKHRHMGDNSSVPVELAQELMESMEYTIDQAGGLYTHADVERALRLGQQILEQKLGKAKSMLYLVRGTAPGWQTECRWDALRYLERYLADYDHLHLAHRGPDALFYPILISMPGGIRGIDCCLFYLQVLWVENQIMAGFGDDVLEAFWNRLPAAALNQCEYLLVNGIGKALLDTGIDSLLFHQEDHMRVIPALVEATEDRLYAAAKRLCQWLDLKDEVAVMYVEAAVSQMLHWTGERVWDMDISNLFL